MTAKLDPNLVAGVRAKDAWYEQLLMNFLLNEREQRRSNGKPINMDNRPPEPQSQSVQ